MSYWASGEFDEHGNYILPRTWNSLPDHGPKKLEINVNLERIKDKEESIAFKSREYYDWLRFYSYACQSVDFYWQTLAAFNNYYLNKKIKNLPVRFHGWQSLVWSANNLSQAEDKLLKQFGNSNRDVINTIKKSADLVNANYYAGLAWMMYHMMYPKLVNPQHKEDLSNLLSNGLALSANHPSEDSEKLIFLRDMLQQQNELVKSDFLYKTHGWLYKKLDSVQLFDKVMETAQGTTTQMLNENIAKYSSSGEYKLPVKQVVWFYLNRNEILIKIKLLRQKTKMCKPNDIEIFIDDNTYEQLASYREKLLEVYNFAKKNLSEAIVDDVLKVGKSISAELKNAEPIYKEYISEVSRLDAIINQKK